MMSRGGISASDEALLDAYNLDPGAMAADFSASLDAQVGALEQAALEMGLRAFLRHMALRALIAEDEVAAALREAHDANAALEALVPPPGATIH